MTQTDRAGFGCRALSALVALIFLTGGTVLGEPLPTKGELILGPAQPVARFFAGGDRGFLPEHAVTSFALRREFAKSTDLPDAYAVRPVFERVGAAGEPARHRVRIDLPAGTSLYGTGEVSGPLLRNGRSVTLWNTDAYAYDIDAPSLYQSHPWVLAVRPDGTAFGVLADTTWRTTIDLDGAIQITSDGPPFAVYVIDRATPQEVCTALAELTGPMPLPPLWSLGYHQSRYSYYPESKVREVAAEFRKRGIPCDGLWLDLDYMDGARVFTIDQTRFPDVGKLNTDLGAMGFRTVWILDPGLKVEPLAAASPSGSADAGAKPATRYALADELIAAGFAVLDAKGDAYQGAVWPGLCVFPDFLNDKARAWWADKSASFIGTLAPSPVASRGFGGLWVDMNEPAIFGTDTKTMPPTNTHKGGLYRADASEGQGTVAAGSHARYHNVYGAMMAKATQEGLLKARPSQRPFVLTRAGFLGSHRYAATWTGDNSANWFDLEHAVPMALNLGLSGQPFIGCDIGGFNGNGPGSGVGSASDEARAEHFARWMGVGSLMPFCRGHTGKGNIAKEPWAFGPKAEATCRAALQRRSRLIPYIYTMFQQASVTGMPVMRPAFFAATKTQALRSEDDCFILGGDVLVVPQMMPDRSRVPLVPRGVWRRFDVINDWAAAMRLGAAAAAPVDDPNLPELSLREGAILPVGPVMQHTGERPLDELTLFVSLDSRGTATGTLYEDAGDGFEYKDGQYLLTTYTAKRNTTPAADEVVVSIGKVEGKQARPSRKVTVVVLRDDGRTSIAEGVDGQAITVPLK